MRGLTVRQRIENKTDMSAGPESCWPWIGGKGNSGTPTMQIQKQSRSVRRLLWELDYGSTPENYVVSDSCGNRQCVNPAHLRLRSFILEERIWELCDRSGGPNACWPWKLRRSARSGYGCFFVKGKGKQVAHRWAWQVTNGPIPDGMYVCHHCDNPPCINPKHLFLGTPMENVKDMIRKGRQSCGPVHSEKMRKARKSVLTPEVVAKIIERRRLGFTQRSIAEYLGIAPTSVHNALARYAPTDSPSEVKE